MFTINKMLLGCLCLSLCSSIAFAQRGAIELAAGGGVSMNSAPSGTLIYVGSKSPVNYSTQLNALYNVHRNISIGLDVRLLELSRITDTSLTPTEPATARKIMYSKAVFTPCAVTNGKINIMRGYIYGGVALGYALNTHTDFSINRSKETYRTPGGGNGPVIGAQLGFTYGINRFMGIYAEAALRNITLESKADAPKKIYTQLNYNITAYNLTVGVKFRIMPPRRVQNDIPGMRGQGRSL